jgi:EAL domain-containing protein (putative c-di-GMP-specific phosphodiesterase class I)
MYVGVNVSAREVQETDFVEGVREALTDHGVDASSLVIEITETALLRATPATIAALTALNHLGVRVVIDNFGSGYFSLSHLRQFPVDALKIAKEFVQDVDEASKSSALAGAIIAMSRSLGIETVAEGIETSEQADRMQRLGCAFGQGYAFARPMNVGDLLASWGEPAAMTTAPATAATKRTKATVEASVGATTRRVAAKVAPVVPPTRRPAGA